jgi:hypothetical protein
VQAAAPAEERTTPIWSIALTGLLALGVLCAGAKAMVLLLGAVSA